LRANEKVKFSLVEGRFVLTGDPQGIRVAQFRSCLGWLGGVQLVDHRTGQILPLRKLPAYTRERLGIKAKPGSDHHGRSGFRPLPQVGSKLPQVRKIGEVHVVHIH
jgi:hypothetical protein